MWAVIDLYLTTRNYASPLGGRPLPCPGAPGEQPAALMDAFAILDKASAGKE